MGLEPTRSPKIDTLVNVIGDDDAGSEPETVQSSAAARHRRGKLIRLGLRKRGFPAEAANFHPVIGPCCRVSC